MPALHESAARVLRDARGRAKEIDERLSAINLQGIDYKTLGLIVATDGLLRDALKTLPKAKAPRLQAVATSKVG